MLFWIAVAALAAATTFLVTRPLLSGEAVAVENAPADVAVYRDQLTEIDADLQRGAITTREAEAARAEVARRLLRSADDERGDMAAPASAPNSVAKTVPKMHRFLHGLLSVALPVASLALYLGFGEPGLPAQPAADRRNVPATAATAEELVARVEAALSANPKDGRGWQVIAPVYMAQQRYGDAARAYANAMQILGESESRLGGFAEARIREDDGIVSEDARTAFERLLKLNPKSVEARFWLAAAREQNGEREAAIAGYRALLDDAPGDAPWRGMVEQRLQAASKAANGSAATSDKPGVTPGAAQTATPSNSGAATPPPDMAKIRQMVDGLAARLGETPNDLTGWIMLIRSYRVLGETDRAQQALASAQKTFANDASAQSALDGVKTELGLGGGK